MRVFLTKRSRSCLHLVQCFVVMLVTVTSVVGVALTQQQASSTSQGVSVEAQSKESAMLSHPIQLTGSDRFIKAGEAYFSPHNNSIIFQAIEHPKEGQEASPHYAMYVGTLQQDEAGHYTGLTNIRQLSADGSANTCGWFDPNDPDRIYFATTRVPPGQQDAPGYQRDRGRYRWQFPVEMNIVRCDLDNTSDGPPKLETIIENPDAYVAEGALSPSGRYMVFCSLESGAGDLYIKDLVTDRITRVVHSDGYDGGPFFSPDGKRICYRSDRRGDNHLQLFVADLAFNDQGEVVGIEREHQVTNNAFVNWAPYWHPDGRHLVYATSAVGHHNYEVFLIDADSGEESGSRGTLRYGTNPRRVTDAEGFDGLPVFSPDGQHLMWTSQRGDDGSSQVWIAEFSGDLDAIGSP